jgi:O-acetylserine/cysteine efflux transporter
MDQAEPAPLAGRDFAAALGVVLIWGSNFVAMKWALQSLTPFQLGAGRYLFAVMPLILVIRPPRLPWRLVALYGLLQGVGQFGLLFLALRYGMTAALASVLLQTQVFFTALFGLALLGERLSRPQLTGLVIAALALLCFGLNYAGRDSVGGGMVSFILCLGGAAMWAASNIVVRRARETVPDFNVAAFMVWSSLTPILPFFALSLAFDPPSARGTWMHLGWPTWAALGYLGWCSTILAYALWTGLLKRHPANRVAPFSLGVPLVGVLAGMALLGEAVTPWQWAGIALVLLSLCCVMLGGRRLFRPAAPAAAHGADAAPTRR